MAVDGDSSSFWASRFEESGEVVVNVQTSIPTVIDTLVVSWAFVPMSFSVQVASGASGFETIFKTDANHLNVTVFALGGRRVQRVRLLLKVVRGARFASAFVLHLVFACSHTPSWAAWVVEECMASSPWLCYQMGLRCAALRATWRARTRQPVTSSLQALSASSALGRKKPTVRSFRN